MIHRRRSATYPTPFAAIWGVQPAPKRMRYCFACKVNDALPAPDILCAECLKDWEDIG